MFKIKKDTAPHVFQTKFTEIHYHQATKSSKNTLVCTQIKFLILLRRLVLWNNVLDNKESSRA